MGSPGKNTGMVVISSSWGSSQSRDQTCISCISSIAGSFVVFFFVCLFYCWATWKTHIWLCVKSVSVLATQLCLILCNPMDSSPPGSSVREVLRKEYWSGYHPFSRGSSQTRDRTQVSHIAGRFFTTWAFNKAMYDMCVYVCVCVCVSYLLSCVQFFVSPCTVAHLAPLSMKFSRQEYRSGLPFLSAVYDLR